MVHRPAETGFVEVHLGQVEFGRRDRVQRAFERRFQLADFVRVSEADLADGLLAIDLVREVPEAMKPHKIAIGAAAPVIEAKKAA